MKQINIGILASGSGTNAENIVNYFSKNQNINVRVIICNRKEAYVLQRAKKLGVPSEYLPKESFEKEEVLTGLMKKYSIDFVVLAGFLLKVPKFLIAMYPSKIVNIHPALLPNYGGKGMYGDRVHEAVIKAKEKFSGITIHFIDEEFDKGIIMAQIKCIINENDTAKDLAAKIHSLEQAFFPRVLEQIINNIFI